MIDLVKKNIPPRKLQSAKFNVASSTPKIDLTKHPKQQSKSCDKTDK